MAAATHDGLPFTLGDRHEQSGKHFTKQVRFKAADIAEGVGVGAGESVEFLTIKGGSLVQGVVSVLRVAEGGTLTVDIGDETDPDGWLDGGNANGTADAKIALAGTEAYVAAAPKFYASDTGLRITCVNAADAAEIDILVHGIRFADID